MNVSHPTKICIPLAAGLDWGGGNLVQQKIDGMFATRDADGGILAGESIGGEFITFDCIQFNGEDVRNYPLRDRIKMRDSLAQAWGIPIVPETTGNGGEFLKRVLDAGGEGAVLKSPGSYHEAMIACKRVGTWRCVVTALNLATGGATIADAVTMEPRGTVPLRNRAALCRVGSVVKVEGENLSARGLILKPRPCKDSETSWLLQY